MSRSHRYALGRAADPMKYIVVTTGLPTLSGYVR